MSAPPSRGPGPGRLGARAGRDVRPEPRLARHQDGCAPHVSACLLQTTAGAEMDARSVPVVTMRDGCGS